MLVSFSLIFMYSENSLKKKKHSDNSVIILTMLITTVINYNVNNFVWKVPAPLETQTLTLIWNCQLYAWLVKQTNKETKKRT